MRRHAVSVVLGVLIAAGALAAEADREKLHRQLLETSRRVGMAEVATGVLHNVGNVLNSVNVAADVIGGKLRQGHLPDLRRDLGWRGVKPVFTNGATHLLHGPRGRPGAGGSALAIEKAGFELYAFARLQNELGGNDKDGRRRTCLCGGRVIRLGGLRRCVRLRAEAIGSCCGRNINATA